jgi:hypothetical protein
MKKYVIKDHDSYFTGTFESGGVIIMTCFSNVKEDAKIFNSNGEALETLNRIKHQDAYIEEI